MAITKKRRPSRREEDEVLDLIDLEEDFDDDFEEEEEEEVKPKRTKRPSASKGSTSKASKTKSTKSSGTVSIKGAVQKLGYIRDEMKQSVFEREEVIDDILRCLVAGENILLLGPPGTGKSYLANLVAKHIEKADFFAWLMNRTTDPADIVGPYSVKAMENDRFLRITTGKLPEAHIGFLDEIFKSNEPTLNYMLSMLNEGVIYNDGKAVPVQLRLTIGASNEYPESEDLDAFYDRFVFRHWVNYIQDPNARMAMANASRVSNTMKRTTISLEEIDALQAEVKNINFPPQVAKTYDKMIRALQNKDIQISDRRYVKGQMVMMANAILNGRQSVTTDDFRCLTFMMWNKDVQEIEVVAEELAKFVNPFESKIKELARKASEVRDKVLAVENRAERAGEAVQANVAIQDILDKIEVEIDAAQNEGVSTDPLAKVYEDVEKILAQLAQECLKQTGNRNGRKW